MAMEAAGPFAAASAAGRAADDPWETRTVWDRILGVITMAVTSAAGWTAIIAIVRYLR